MSKETKSAEQKGNHKGDGKDQRRFPPKNLEMYLNVWGYDRIDCDIATQGGLITKKGKLAGYLKPPRFRSDVGPKITKDDIRPVSRKNKPENEQSFDQTDTGLEIEFFGFDKYGEVISMMNDGDPFLTSLKTSKKNAEAQGLSKIDFSKEFIRNCVEANMDHGTDIPKRNQNYLTTVTAIVDSAEKNKIYIAPLANIPHRGIVKNDVTDDAYVHRIAYDFMTWSVVQHFDIASQQPHIEILDHKAARQTINYMQLISPILLASTLCGPFMDGKIEADLYKRYGDIPTIEGDVLKEKTWQTLETGEYQSYRTIGRFLGSPSGGILREPIPVEEVDFITSIGKKLKNGEVPSAGREGGHHTDRYRPDILPYGTIELCGLDPSGGKMERVLAMREFTRALGWKMQMLFITGQFEEKAKEFKALFGKTPSRETFEISHWNSLVVTKDGTNATIEGMDGNNYPVSQLWQELIRFVQEPLSVPTKNITYKGLPSGIVKELKLAFMDPEVVFGDYQDENGYTSAKGFYESGRGNLSVWMLQGAKERCARGMSEKEAIKQVTVDVGKSFHDHVKNMTLERLQSLYR